MSSIRQKTIAGFQKGDRFCVSRTFSEQDVRRFAEVSRDYNPVHFDERFARVKSFNGLICHGLLVGSLLTEIGGQIGWLASGMDFKFKHPVYVGDTIRCEMVITELDERGRAKADTVFVNERGMVVLKAEVTGIVPGEKEILVIRQMLAEGDPTNRYGR